MLITLIGFVAGLALVGAAIGLTHHFLQCAPALASRRAAVLEITHRPTRIEAARAELGRTRSELKTLVRELEKLRGRLADWLPLEDAAGNAWKFMVVAGLLGFLEAILFLLYGLGSRFGDAPPWLLALIAPSAAAITLVLMHVLLAAALASRHRPARTLYRARVGLVVAILAVILAVWAVLGGRNLTDVAAIETLTALGLMTLASTTSLAGGFAALVATTLMEERRLERTVARLEACQQALDEHRAVIEADLARLADASGQQMSSGFAAPASVVPLIILAILASPKLTVAQSSTPPAFARAGVCELVLDLTTSVNPLVRQRALVHTRENLPAMVDALGCTVVRVVPFSGDLLLDITEISLPAVTDPPAACRNAVPPPASGVSLTTAILYPSVAQERVRQARQACETKITLQRQQQIAARRQALTQVASALDRAASLAPRGSCTALNLAVRRALQRAEHVTVITDGVNTCRTPPPGAATIKNSTLLFLLVPSNRDTPDAPEAMFARLDALERAFSGSRALLLPELTPTFWQQPPR